nr:glycosyltransferase family 2 protein [Candidatus Freyrarchaeum guaymaensis]
MLSKMKLDASVIILTKNAGNRFKNVMKKIFDQEKINFEVIIIDSGSTDETLKIAKEFDTKIVKIKPKDFHHGRTRNLGASLSKGKYLIYITQDATPLYNDLFSKLISHLSNENVAGVYGRQIAYPYAKPMEKFFYSYFYPPKKKVITPNDVGESLEEFCMTHVYISNVCSAMKKEIWKKIKFDETIIMAEDKKWAIDVLKYGYYIVYEPKAIVYHSHNYSIISAFRRRFNDGVAMRQICGSNGIISRGFFYLLSEIKYLLRHNMIWIPYALIYEFAKFTGFLLGINYKHVPIMLRKKISEYRIL